MEVSKQPQVLRNTPTTACRDGYPNAGRVAVIFVALLLPVFCLSLDNTILSTAIPRITGEFKSIQDISWYGSSYMLTSSAFQIVFGKLYTLAPTKIVYLSGLVVFESGSAVCGAARGSSMLIAGRALSGAGAAGILNGSVHIIARTVPIEKRSLYTGLIGGTYGAASVVGPILGGVITENVSWRWCFYLNLPMGALSFFAVGLLLSRLPAPQSLGTWKEYMKCFDVYGLLCFLPMVTLILLVLQWGGSKYDWSDMIVVALLLVFGLLFILFIRIQTVMKERALIPSHLIRNGNVASVCFFIACLAGSLFVFLYYLSVWFQVVKGASPTGSGVRMIPLVLSMSLASVIAGALTTKFGYCKPFLIGSSILMSIGGGLLSTLNEDTPREAWIGFQILFGAGVGMGMQQPLIAVQAVLSHQDVSIGTAMTIFFQALGGSIFLAIGQQVFASHLRSGIKTLVPSLNPQVIQGAGATASAIAQNVPSSMLKEIRQAYNSALTSTFYVPVATAAASLFGAVIVEWTSVKKSAHGTGDVVETGKK